MLVTTRTLTENRSTYYIAEARYEDGRYFNTAWALNMWELLDWITAAKKLA